MATPLEKLFAGAGAGYELEVELSQEQLNILKHTLGIGTHKACNSFYSFEATPDITLLVETGHMELVQKPFWGGYYYRATQKGMDFALNGGLPESPSNAAARAEFEADPLQWEAEAMAHV